MENDLGYQMDFLPDTAFPENKVRRKIIIMSNESTSLNLDYCSQWRFCEMQDSQKIRLLTQPEESLYDDEDEDSEGQPSNPERKFSKAFEEFFSENE
jgi:hypothetical protein